MVYTYKLGKSDKIQKERYTIGKNTDTRAIMLP